MLLAYKMTLLIHYGKNGGVISRAGKMAEANMIPQPTNHQPLQASPRRAASPVRVTEFGGEKTGAVTHRGPGFRVHGL